VKASSFGRDKKRRSAKRNQPAHHHSVIRTCEPQTIHDASKKADLKKAAAQSTIEKKISPWTNRGLKFSTMMATNIVNPHATPANPRGTHLLIKAWLSVPSQPRWTIGVLCIRRSLQRTKLVWHRWARRTATRYGVWGLVSSDFEFSHRQRFWLGLLAFILCYLAVALLLQTAERPAEARGGGLLSAYLPVDLTLANPMNHPVFVAGFCRFGLQHRHYRGEALGCRCVHWLGSLVAVAQQRGRNFRARAVSDGCTWSTGSGGIILRSALLACNSVGQMSHAARSNGRTFSFQYGGIQNHFRA